MIPTTQEMTYGDGRKIWNSSTKIISLMSAWKVPFRNVQAGDRLLIMTDDSMDPMVWQSAMAALQERGAEVTLALYPRRTYHCGDPTAMAVSAAKEADAVVALTTTALNSGTPACARSALKAAGSGRTPIWLMEETTVEILTEGGGRATVEDLEQICDLQRRIGEVYDHGKNSRDLAGRQRPGRRYFRDAAGLLRRALAQNAVRTQCQDRQTGRRHLALRRNPCRTGAGNRQR